MSNPPKDTVLIVDDEPANLAVVANYLANSGFSVKVARTGESGLDLARQIPPDLILLDVLLPGIDGVEVCRRLKADARTRLVPVIFMTIVTNVEEKLKGFDAGGVDYITKPFQRAEVLARVTTHLTLHRLQRELRELNRELEEKVAARTAELTLANQRLQQDITQRKQAQMKLAREKSLLRTLIDSVSDLIFIKDRDGVYQGCNKASEAFIGMPEGEQIGKTDFDFFDREKAEEIQKGDRRVIEDGSPLRIEEWVTGRDGRRLLMDTIKAPYYDPDGEALGLVGIGRDITERKQMEAALAAREREFRSLAENSPDNIARYDLNGRTLYVNPSLEKTLGRPASEILGKTPSEARPIDAFREYQEKIAAVLETGAAAEMDIVMPDGGEGVRHYNIRFVAERGADGMITGVLAISRDVTERVQAEAKVRLLNQELEQRVADRTASLEAASKELGAFAYSVSHDLRAPLRHIDGFLELLKKKAGQALDDQSRHYMDTISQAANKMGHLIDDLLSFSRMGRKALSLQPVDLDALVRDVIRDLEPDAAGREIEWRIGGLPAVHGDAAMLRMVLGNLIANALKFTLPRQQARIEIGSISGRGSEEASSDVSETVVFVRDNGVGFDMAYAAKLFGVFQRLHRVEEFEGTGIGLASVRRIIDRHGGRTWAEGEIDQGASFYFSLPRSIQGA
jgi:PAS domain S-box-containing protein